VRAYVERRTGATEESEVGAGTLFSSGLIAGGSLCGILFAVLVGVFISVTLELCGVR